MSLALSKSKRRETFTDPMQRSGGMCYDWRDEDELDRPDAPITATGLAIWIPLTLLYGAVIGYGVFQLVHAMMHRG